MLVVRHEVKRIRMERPRVHSGVPGLVTRYDAPNLQIDRTLFS